MRIGPISSVAERPITVVRTHNAPMSPDPIANSGIDQKNVSRQRPRNDRFWLSDSMPLNTPVFTQK